MNGILRNTDLRLDEGDVILGVLAGAAAGGFLLSAEAFVAMAWPPYGCGPACGSAMLGTLLFLGLASLIAAFIYGLGLALLAGPLWWLLHRSGYRGWLAAVLLGAVLNLVVGVVIAGCSLGIVACLTGTGAVVGLLVWRVAYRKTSTTSPRSTLAGSPPAG